MQKTNSELAKEHNTTSRQISKSRKRGYILTSDGKRVKFTAPVPAFITTTPTGHKSMVGKQMITVTIKTEDSCESVPVRDDTRVKDISLYLFNEYTTKGIKYSLNLHKNKELN